MNIRTYITQTERKYKYRIKACYPLDNEIVTKILTKYKPLEVKAAVKTPFQANPMGFDGVVGSEVWIMDIVLGLPASLQVMKHELVEAFRFPQHLLIVRGEHEPVELNDESAKAYAEIQAEAIEKGFVRAFTVNDPEYKEYEIIDVKDMVGQNRVNALVGYLKTVQDERNEKMKVHNPLFGWTGATPEKPDFVDYNADLEDAPKVVKKETAPVTDNLPITHKEMRVAFVDKDGKEVFLTRKVGM